MLQPRQAGFEVLCRSQNVAYVTRDATCYVQSRCLPPPTKSSTPIPSHAGFLLCSTLSTVSAARCPTSRIRPSGNAFEVPMRTAHGKTARASIQFSPYLRARRPHSTQDPVQAKGRLRTAQNAMYTRTTAIGSSLRAMLGTCELPSISWRTRRPRRHPRTE